MARIVWIEDDHEKFSYLVEPLEKDGHEILPFGSWHEVEEHIDTICASDAIILDIMLPSIGDDPYLGLSILENLRQHGYQGPVVVCTRVQNPVVIRDLRRLDVTEILQKPVLQSEVHSAVTAALKSD